jgi:hypothetical protein
LQTVISSRESVIGKHESVLQPEELIALKKADDESPQRNQRQTGRFQLISKGAARKAASAEGRTG